MCPVVQLYNVISYDADTIAHLARLSTYDTALADALDALIVGLKLDGLWTKIHAICVQHYAASDSLLDLKGVQDSVALSGATWSASGWTIGTLNGECIDSQVVPSTSALINVNDNHLMTYINTAATVDGFFAGAGSASSDNISMYYDTTTTPDTTWCWGDDWASSEAAGYALDNPSGFILGSLLNNASAVRINANEATATETIVDATMPANTIYVGGYNGFSTNDLDNTRFTGWSAGGGLTATERANYYSRVQTYMATMGWNA